MFELYLSQLLESTLFQHRFAHDDVPAMRFMRLVERVCRKHDLSVLELINAHSQETCYDTLIRFCDQQSLTRFKTMAQTDLSPVSDIDVMKTIELVFAQEIGEFGRPQSL